VGAVRRDDVEPTKRAKFLIGRIRRDLYALERHLAEDGRAVVTGWRLVRGTHGITYVEDPEGTDRLPDELEAL
jgi:hypothetical protein